MSDRDPRAPYKPECPDGACLIPLTQGQWAIVDEGKYEWLMQWRWYADWNPGSGGYYAVRKCRVTERKKGECQRSIFMHRAVMGLDRLADCKTYVDHTRHNTLDNRVSQLECVTNRQNGRNRKNPGASRHPNVSWHAQRRTWRVQVRVKKIKVHMAYFKDEDEAGAFAEVVRDYVDVNPECTVQDLKDLRAKLRTERGKICQK